MKKILFGIALILFGLMCFYVAIQGELRGLDTLGLICGFLGLLSSIVGFCEKEK